MGYTLKLFRFRESIGREMIDIIEEIQINGCFFEFKQCVTDKILMITFVMINIINKFLLQVNYIKNIRYIIFSYIS